MPGPDPMLVRRAHIGRAVSIGKGIGYACFGGALVLFFVGLLTRFSGPLSTIVVVLLVVGCLVLPPAIVFGYGLRAAEREEREEAAAQRAARRRDAAESPSAGRSGDDSGHGSDGADRHPDQG